jgi:hypothetical protein
MISKITLTLFLLVCIAATSCKKSSNSNSTNTACNGKNLCMKIDGTQLSEDAKWTVISSGRRRIFWETGTGAAYQNIELDMYDTVATTGTYTVSQNPVAGQAGFQYYAPSLSKNLAGTSGTVTLTSVANNMLTGSFVITAKDITTGAVSQVTEGNFVNVPKK